MPAGTPVTIKNVVAHDDNDRRLFIHIQLGLITFVLILLCKDLFKRDMSIFFYFSLLSYSRMLEKKREQEIIRIAVLFFSAVLFILMQTSNQSMKNLYYYTTFGIFNAFRQSIRTLFTNDSTNSL